MTVIVVTMTLAALVPLAPEAATPTYAQSAAAALAAINAYRALATVGATSTAALAPVATVPALNDGAFNHSRYMVKNNTGAHDEVDTNVWRTANGDQAGNNGNTFVSWPAAAFNDQMPIDFWIAGAFHQMHMMDPRLQQVGYGAYTEATAAANDIEAGATLDVLSGAKGAAGSKPIMFPGHNKVMTLRQFGGNEFPSPFTHPGCSGFVAPTGPHITLQIAVVPNVTASSITRNGTPVEHCRYDETTYSNPVPNDQALGRIVLANSIDGTATRHAIALLPRFPLTDGTYNVSITSNGTTYAWTFFVGAPPVQRTLTIAKNGTGAGTVTGSGINCGGDCSESYAHGTIVTLTAAPAGGSSFAGWSGGGCAGTGGCQVTMDGAKTVTATFNTAPIPQRALTVTKAGTGSGTVTGTGISCGADCTESYNDGTVVALTATAAGGSTFAGWSNACTGTAATCNVTMNAAKTATATFNVAPVGTFAATAVAGPTSAVGGSAVNITATARVPFAGNYVVDIEVYNAAGAQVFQWYWENQPFAAGVPRHFNTSWQVPVGAPDGAYSVKVGIFSGAGWVTEHLWNDNAATVNVAACTPRPRVRLTTIRGAQGQLLVTATAGGGALRQIRLGAATNARVSIPAGAGGRPALTNSAGNTALSLTERPVALTFSVFRAVGGQATTVPLVLVDDCGEWRTFVGGGRNGF